MDPITFVFCLVSYLVFYFLPIAARKKTTAPPRHLPWPAPPRISRGPLHVLRRPRRRALPPQSPAAGERRPHRRVPLPSVAPAVLGRRRAPPLPSCRWPPLSTAPTVPGRRRAPPPPSRAGWSSSIRSVIDVRVWRGVLALPAPGELPVMACSTGG